ncbi:MAG: glycosyltransferase [Chitinophagaceae bacterium]|nr:glycosyltransferase [Chitinophagaceae bacterium]
MYTPNHIPDQPLVSIAMCTYNGATSINAQMDSIIQQTYRHLEIVIVDDCSADNTPELIQAYQERDDRIRFYRNDKNLGYNKNFEKACLLTTGNYIAISDQDDIWDLNKIEVMMAKWDKESVFVYSISKDFFGDAPLEGDGTKPIRYYEGSMPEKLAFDSPIHGHACMFQRSLLKAALPFPDTTYYDWWLSMIASATDKVSCIKETLTHHRIRAGNSSRTLLDIKEKDERIEKVRRQCITHMEAFLSQPAGSIATRTILAKYILLLRRKKSNGFSWPLFSFFFTHRNIVFHYKRRQNVFSLLKNSFKKSFTGL